ncbi:replication initiator [Frankia sp. Cj5]|uniref:replication initiator n=1 Tax=Frankia sp. Cj5 TaxID=2880978 RepID=UPI001EF5B51D|nr:replication initiator [Frankia sp. Cj5]
MVFPVIPEAVTDVLDRARAGTLDRWQEQAASTGWCSTPIRLRGEIVHIDRISGASRVVYSTAGEPDGILLTSCKNRRATACPSCSHIHQGDCYQLTAAGMRGGKGVPATVAEHPLLFVTLTAPAFGAVHSQRNRGRPVQVCHPRRGDSCSHGQSVACWERHAADDPALGEPLCPDCFDTAGLLLWNNRAPELWRRTRVRLVRMLARHAGRTVRVTEATVRITFVKVAESQQRGAIHLHGILRADGRDPADPKAIVPPPGWATADVLADAVQDAVRRERAPCPDPDDPDAIRDVRWGDQLDIEPISGTRAAGYLAKYTTKGTDPFGALDRRIRSLDDLDRLPITGHMRRLVETAWELGGRPHLADLGLRRWAHTLGFGGHWMTKSRTYSTTLGALRAARADRHRTSAASGALAVDSASSDFFVASSFVYAGTGYRTSGDLWLALSAAAHAREKRVLSREEQRIADHPAGFGSGSYQFPVPSEKGQ